MARKGMILGCISIPLVVVLLVALVGVLLYVAGPPESRRQKQDLDVPASANPGAPPRQAEAAASEPALLVSIDVEEGSVAILPAGPGESISVDSDYDAATHTLSTDLKPGSPERFDLAFHATGGLNSLRQMLHHVETETRLVVRLPVGVPMHLDVRTRKGEFELQLTGLSLRRLSVDHAMGEMKIALDAPNPVQMDRLEIRGKMGELVASGLGHAAARDLVFSGRMGDYQLGMDGQWTTSLRADVSVAMASARIEVPPDVEIDRSGSRVMFGEVSDRAANRTRRDPELNGVTQIFQVRSRVTFGELEIR